MKITIAHIAARRAAGEPSVMGGLIAEYVRRAGRYLPVAAQAFASEAALLAWIEQAAGRTRPHVLLLDSCGQALSSEAFAGQLGRLRDTGTQQLVLAVGPADGWSDAARKRADTLVSLGLMTLPHELARLVLAEQLYRALTILAGHPYHTGH